MWRSFYGNLSKGLPQAGRHAKFRSLQTSIQPIASFRWARWPFQRSYAGQLDRIQLKMLATMLGIAPKPAEPFDASAERRHREAGRLAAACGRWSNAWARSLTTWNDHLHRRHNTGTWAPALLRWHDQGWLSWRRLLESIGSESRTRTRAYRGKAHRIWEESLNEARALL